MILTTNKKKNKLFISLVIVTLFIFVLPVFVYATNTDTISTIEIYKDAGLLVHMNIIVYFLSQLGWLLAKGLYYLVAGLEDVVLSINDVMGGFFTSPEFTDFLDKFKPLMIGLLIISIATLGFMFMFKPKMDKSKVVTNVILAVLIIVGLPAGMIELHKLSSVAIEALNSDELSIADEILYKNIIDVTLYDSMGMPVPIPELDKNISFDKSKIVNIDPTETVDYKKMKEEDVWKHTVKYDDNGQARLEKNSKGFFDIEFMSSLYFRYKIDYFSIFTTLIISMLALVLSGIKIARLLYELAVNQSIAFFMAFTDLASGARLKKCINMILGTFVILFACFFLLQLYVIGTAFCNKNLDNIFARLIAMAALAWAVIDGPNLIERIIGIDAGINSALRTMAGAYAASATIGKISRGMKNGISGFTQKAKNTVSSTIRTGAKGVGMATGAIDAKYETKNNTKNQPKATTDIVPVKNESQDVSQAVSKRTAQEIAPVRTQNSTGQRFTNSTPPPKLPPQQKNTTNSSQTSSAEQQQNSPSQRTSANNTSSQGANRQTSSTNGSQSSTGGTQSQNTQGSSYKQSSNQNTYQENAQSHENTSNSANDINNEQASQNKSPNKEQQHSSKEEDYTGRTWKSERVAQYKQLNQSQTAKGYRRSYNLTKNSIVQSYEDRTKKKEAKEQEKRIQSLFGKPKNNKKNDN